MSYVRNGKRRSGSVLVFLVMCMVGLIGLVAMAVEIGLVAVARTQCQNAADAAAMAGARTIDGNALGNYNVSSVPVSSVKAAVANTVVGKAVIGDPNSVTTSDGVNYTSGNIALQVGAYGYSYDDGDASKEGFKLQFPRLDNTEPYSAVRATITGDVSFAFGKFLGISSKTAGATAVAVHRPRDIVIIMDLSGSMRFQSLAGIPLNGSSASPSSTSRPRTVSMNPESVFPKFGHYSNTSAAALQGTKSYSTGSEMVDPANVSTTTNSGPPVIEDFYKNTSSQTPGPSYLAFSRSPDSQESTPGGYDYLKKNANTSTNYAATVYEVVNQTSRHSAFETYGYENYVGAKPSFYTEGPGYWGKTFFIWPPDPRGSTLDANDPATHRNNGAKDWRQRFFFKYNTSNGTLDWLDHNSILFNSSGVPATYSSPAPTPIRKAPGATTTVVEDGVSRTYTYRINYAAIFEWLKNETPVHFPNQIRAGRIKYYDAIPDPTDTSLNNRFWTTYTLKDLNERFWRDYVDFVLGVKRTGTSGGLVTYDDENGSGVPLSAMIGNGDFYSWGTVSISQKPDNPTDTSNGGISSPTYSGTSTVARSAGSTSAITMKNVGKTPQVGDYVRFSNDSGSGSYYRVKTVNSGTSVTLNRGLVTGISSGTTVRFYRVTLPYMDYHDNPYRPRHQFWFGPMTWVDWLGNYNTSNFMWPGNVHEAQCWACKVGIQTAIDDIKKNHPNDFIGMCFFSGAQTTSSDGLHNRAIVPLGRNYDQLKESLWFPPSTVTGTAKEITPYDADFKYVPRANGSTGPGMGFMIAYNQLSSSSLNLRLYSSPSSTYRGNAGGLGRKGAQRVIIFETDGAPNYRAYATVNNSGADSYYKIRLKNPEDFDDSLNVEFPTGGSYASSEVYDVVKQICALETDSPPGFGTLRKPATVYPIGYGSLFDPTNTSSAQTSALTFLQTVGYYGGTASSTTYTDFPDWARIYGNNSERIERIQKAFTNIMQTGVQVSLIE